MTGWFTTQVPLVLLQTLDDVAVADIGPVESDTCLLYTSDAADELTCV